jgi:hypothetical protein
VLLCGLPSVIQGQAWERLADMPVAVAAPAVSVVGRRAVVTGGVLLGGGPSDAVQVLDLDKLTWSLAAGLNTARYQHAQVTLGDGRILVVGGRARRPGNRPHPLVSCELIDLDKGVSEPTADLPMPMRSPTLHLLPDGRAAAIGNHIVAVYDPEQGAWTIGSPLMQPRRGHASLVLEDGTILVAGGIGRSSFERVDLAKGSSILMQARLAIPLDDLALAPLPGGRVWVIGGQGLDGQTTDQTWVLSVGPESDSGLAPGPALGVANGVADHVVIQTPNGIVVSGGESQRGRADTELADAFWLDPKTLAVRRLPSTEIAHDDAVGLCDGGWAIVFGGQVKESFLGAEVPTPIRAVHRIMLPGGGGGGGSGDGGDGGGDDDGGGGGGGDGGGS